MGKMPWFIDDEILEWVWAVVLILTPALSVMIFLSVTAHQSNTAYQRALTTVIECRNSLSTQDSAKRLDICGPIPQRKDF
jgi:hypothetical protein